MTAPPRRGDRAGVAHERPDAVLVFDVVEAAELARQRHREVHQPTALGRVREREARAERRHVHEARQLHPLVLRRLAAVDADGQRQLQTLAHSLRFSSLFHPRNARLAVYAEAQHIAPAGHPEKTPLAGPKTLILQDFRPLRAVAKSRLPGYNMSCFGPAVFRTGKYLRASRIGPRAGRPSGPSEAPSAASSLLLGQ